MDLQSILFALLFGGAIWLTLRLRAQHRRRLRRDARPAPASGEPGEPATMPRVGRPGTITRDQVKALAGQGIQAPREWSREEADLLLDGIEYLRRVCRRVTGRDPDETPLEVQNRLLHFILGRDDLREHVRGWGQAHRSGGRGGRDASLPDSPELAEVAAEAKRLLASADVSA